MIYLFRYLTPIPVLLIENYIPLAQVCGLQNNPLYYGTVHLNINTTKLIVITLISNKSLLYIRA